MGWEGKTPEKKPRFVFRIGDMTLLSKNVLGEKSELMGDFNEGCDFQHGGTRILNAGAYGVQKKMLGPPTFRVYRERERAA